jgi:RsiW-degrading membrane proteinase PrsW (M82 family)
MSTGAAAPVRPTPPAAHPRYWLRLPACWLLIGLLLAGGWRVGSALGAAFTAYPFATGLAVLLFGLYAVPFLLFILHLDYFEREPPVLLAAAFGWGALVAMAAAVPGNGALDNLIAKLVSPGFAARWGPALTAPTVEEPLKLLGVVLIALVAREQINSIVDGFVYGAVAGLGFQVVEDVLYAVSAVARDGLGDHAGPVLTTFVGRGFVAGLWSHTTFSALAGAGIGYAVVRHDRSRTARLGVAALCLAGAWGCHGLWNSPLLAAGLHLGAVGVLVELLVKGIPALVLILALVRSASRREAVYYGQVLAGLADEQVATRTEIEALASPARRAAARRAGHRLAGVPGFAAVTRLQRAQAHLAVELSRGSPLDSAPVRRRYRDVLRSRRRLRALGELAAADLAAAGGRAFSLTGVALAGLFGLALNLLLLVLGV